MRLGPPPIKGPTKYFFEDRTLDRLLAMITVLGAEISKVDEKIDTALRLLERKHLVVASEMAGFEPTADEQAASDGARKMFIETLLAPFQQEADALVTQASEVAGGLGRS